MLRTAAQTTYDLDVSINERPRPAPDWSTNFIDGKEFGFVMQYKSYDMNDYDDSELLSDECELTDDTKVYLVLKDM